MDVVRWEPEIIPGDGDWHVAPRWRMFPRRVPYGAEHLADLLMHHKSLWSLPSRLEEFYGFYQSKIQEDLATEKVLAEQLDSVARRNYCACDFCCDISLG